MFVRSDSSSRPPPFPGQLQLVELKCRNCGAQLSPENISPQLSAARCHHCHALFAISAPAAKPIPRPRVSLPKGFQVNQRGDSLEIVRRWLGPSAFFLLFFALFWNGFMLVWHAIALGTGQWTMSLFGLIHTAVGIGLGYYVLGLFINSTTIRAAAGELTVKSGPLPWSGNKTVPRTEVSQLYCKEKIHHGKNGASTTYGIEMVLSGNRRETLVKGLPNSDHALFIEQQIERHLGIVDVPVTGEFGR